jgi:putative oxidoreductase
MPSVSERLLHVENHIHHLLVRHSVAALRISVGAVFLAFGILKYFPGVSPAENLAKTTMDLLTFGLVPGGVAIVVVATLECFIGICLLAGRWMRLAIWLLAAEFVGILSPIVLLTGRLFAGPHGAPTLEGQYVLKDVILVGAGMVIAAATFRGGRLVRADLPPASRVAAAVPLDPEQKLRVVLDGTSDQRLISELCERHQISEAEFYTWRDASVAGAVSALRHS